MYMGLNIVKEMKACIQLISDLTGNLLSEQMHLAFGCLLGNPKLSLMIQIQSKSHHLINYLDTEHCWFMNVIVSKGIYL